MKLEIHDSTLRDGEQMPCVVFTINEKIELAEMFLDFGVDLIDLMPSVSATEKILAEELASRYPNNISASCRMKKEDIDLAASIEVRRIVLFTPLSDIHLQYKLNITREENLERSHDMIDYAKECGLVVDFAGEDCTRADYNYLFQFVKSISSKIRFFYAADTVGYLKPENTFKLISLLTKIHPKISIHAHNDLGLATANTLSAIRAGATSFSGTFTGIGERAGNAPIEEVCMALNKLYGHSLDVKYEKIGEICENVSSYSNVLLQRHKPLVGANAFCHESGIHADGVIKNPSTYEFIDPVSVGKSRSFYFGKHSGTNVLRHFLGDVDEKTVKSLLSLIKNSAESYKQSFSETDILELAEKMKYGRKLNAAVINKTQTVASL